MGFGRIPCPGRLLHRLIIFDSQTPGKQCPFVDEVAKGLYLAVGGCGHAAKSCDEIGRIAAKLTVDGVWDTIVPREAMAARWTKTVT